MPQAVVEDGCWPAGQAAAGRRGTEVAVGVCSIAWQRLTAWSGARRGRRWFHQLEAMNEFKSCITNLGIFWGIFDHRCRYHNVVRTLASKHFPKGLWKTSSDRVVAIRAFATQKEIDEILHKDDPEKQEKKLRELSAKLTLLRRAD